MHRAIHGEAGSAAMDRRAAAEQPMPEGASSGGRFWHREFAYQENGFAWRHAKAGVGGQMRNNSLAHHVGYRRLKAAACLHNCRKSGSRPLISKRIYFEHAYVPAHYG